ncbi:MAG: peroxiredoxin [Ktedonobacterales bacterium]
MSTQERSDAKQADAPGARPESSARHGGVGTRAPDFTLRTQDGDTFRLGDVLGTREIVLYFYPKDNTRGCTAEACAFRDSYEVFREAGAEVIGISADSEASHHAFAERHHLPFTLLSDPHGAVRKRYGVRALLGVMPGRVTFIIDRDGIIRHTFSSQLNIRKHIDEALATIRGLQAAGRDE